MVTSKMLSHVLVIALLTFAPLVNCRVFVFFDLKDRFPEISEIYIQSANYAAIVPLRRTQYILT